MFGRNEKIIERWKKIPGKKIAIQGNHDKNSLLTECFDEVHTFPLFLSENILLSHEPEMCSPYVLNVHGHLHSSRLDSPNHLNVNIAMTDYKLLTIEDIEKIVRGMPKKNKTFLFEWYAEDYVFTKKLNNIAIDSNGKIKLEETLKLQDNKYIKKQFVDINGDLIYLYVKPLYIKTNRKIYTDERGNTYLVIRKARTDYLYDCDIVIKESVIYDPMYEKWYKCWNNGRAMWEVFPEMKKSDCVEYLRVEY